MSNFDASKSNLVILGKWNPAIVEPNWLKMQFSDLIPDASFGMELVLGSPQSVRYDLGQLTLECTNQQLLFRPKEFDVDALTYTKNLAVGIFSKLKHTPITATGCNFIYNLDEKETFKHAYLKDISIYDEFYNGARLNNVTHSTVRHQLSFEYHTLTFLYTFQADLKTLQYNFEYKGDGCVERASESMIENYQETIKLNEYLIEAAI